MRFIVDMNLTPRWIAFLTGEGFDAKHWSEVGDPKAKDTLITNWARQNNFVVITNDMDFPQILAHTRESGPSIILLRGEPLTPEVRGEEFARLLRECSVELSQGAIASVKWGDALRIRLLPLSPAGIAAPNP